MSVFRIQDVLSLQKDNPNITNRIMLDYLYLLKTKPPCIVYTRELAEFWNCRPRQVAWRLRRVQNAGLADISMTTQGFYHIHSITIPSPR